MSYKIIDPSKNKYPDIKSGDTHFLILTKNISLGISLYDTELAWKPIRWNASSLYTRKTGEPVNEYTHYITVRLVDIDFLRVSKDIDYLLFTTVKGDLNDSSDSSKGYKEPILEFHDYIYDPAIGNFNAYNDLSYNYMIGTYDIRSDYYWDDISWNGGKRPETNGITSLKDAPQFDPSGVDRDHGPLVFPLQMVTTEFLLAKIAQVSSVIKKIETLGGTHRVSLRARKWNDISGGNGLFSDNFFLSNNTFDISHSIVTSTNKNTWKNMYLDINDWVDPITDTSFNLSNFIMKSYREDLKISNNSGFSTRTLLYLNKEIRVLQNLGNSNCSATTSHSITKDDFDDYYEDGYKLFQMAIFIVDESYNTTAGSKVNPIEIVLTFQLN